MVDRFECEGVGRSRDEAVANAHEKAKQFYGTDDFRELTKARGIFTETKKTLQGLTEYRAMFQFRDGTQGGRSQITVLE